MNKSSLVIVLILIAAGVGFMRGTFSGGSVEQALVRAADEMNKKLPMTVDSETRWDSTSAGPGRQLTFSYTVINHSKGEMNAVDVEQGIRPILLAKIRSSPEMKKFRENNVTLHYVYKDKTGAALFDIVIAPSDL